MQNQETKPQRKLIEVYPANFARIEAIDQRDQFSNPTRITNILLKEALDARDRKEAERKP